MRIAFVTFEYPPHIQGGAGIYAYKITRELANLGHEVHVFTPQVPQVHGSPGNVTIEGVPINKKRPFIALQFWFALPEVLKAAERRGLYDIVHINGTSYWFLNKLTASTKVVTIHHLAKDSIPYDRGKAVLLAMIEKRAMVQADRIIAVSHHTKRRMVEAYGIDPQKVAVVYNGRSFDQGARIDVEEAARHLSALKGKKTVLFVGRVNDRRKGLDLLIRAMRPVVDRTGAVLLVAGQGDQTGVKKLIADLGLEDNVIFAGFVDDPTLIALYQMCDVYVCPTRLEGFGLTILDAQIYARRIVATDVGAIPEIASAGTLLVKPEAVEDLSSAIVDSLTNVSDPPLPMTDASSNPDQFSWDVTGKRVIDEYHSAK